MDRQRAGHRRGQGIGEGMDGIQGRGHKARSKATLMQGMEKGIGQG